MRRDDARDDDDEEDGLEAELARSLARSHALAARGARPGPRHTRSIRFDLADPRFVRAQAIAASERDEDAPELHALLRACLRDHWRGEWISRRGEMRGEGEGQLLVELLSLLGNAREVADVTGLSVRQVKSRLVALVGPRRAGRPRQRPRGAQNQEGRRSA